MRGHLSSGVSVVMVLQCFPRCGGGMAMTFSALSWGPCTDLNGWINLNLTTVTRLLVGINRWTLFWAHFLIVLSGTFPLTCIFCLYSAGSHAGSQAMSYEVHTVQVQVQVHGAGVVTWHRHRHRHGRGRVLRGDSSGAVVRSLHNVVDVVDMLWILWICCGSCCDTSYCRPIDGNIRFI